MREFRKAAAVVVVVLLVLAAFPCSSLAADGPSNLAVLLQEAFSQPDAPGNSWGIEGITFFHGLVIAKQHWDVWIYYKGGTWAKMPSDVWFQGGPGSSFTIFEDECPPMGIKRGDLLSFDTLDWNGLSAQGFDLSEITGGDHVYQVYRADGFLRVEAVFGVASMGCTVVMLTSPEVYPPSSNLVENLMLVEPDPSQPGWFPLAGSDGKWLGVSPAAPFRNGVDGFLDSYVDAEETVVGIELTRNERGALALIVASLQAVHLLEFEPSGTLHTVIPFTAWR